MATDAEIEAAARAIYKIAAEDYPHAAPFEQLLKAKPHYMGLARAALEAAEQVRRAVGQPRE